MRKNNYSEGFGEVIDVAAQAGAKGAPCQAAILVCFIFGLVIGQVDASGQGEEGGAAGVELAARQPAKVGGEVELEFADAADGLGVGFGQSDGAMAEGFVGEFSQGDTGLAPAVAGDGSATEVMTHEARNHGRDRARNQSDDQWLHVGVIILLSSIGGSFIGVFAARLLDDILQPYIQRRQTKILFPTTNDDA